MASRRPIIAVCGAGSADAETMALAEQVGFELASASVTTVSGGLGGVMEASCRGAKRGGGLTVGILPGTETDAANPYVDVPIASGMSHGRNAIIVHTADGLIALKGAYGTLSEIALARTMGKPVVIIGDWCPIPDLHVYETAQDAVEGILERIVNQKRTKT